jgi:hemolysin activation/secretion protein
VAGESADRTVTPVMRAGRTPGTVEVDLAVEDQLPLHGSLELNARNSINTTRLRLTASLRYDNLWQRFHSASLQFQISPEDTHNVQVWSGTYVMPLEFIDSRLVFYGIGLDSQSAVTSAGALNVVGNGQIFGLRLIKPLPGTRDYSQSVSLGWDYKDFGQSIGVIGADTQNTPISYSPFMVGYSGGYNYADGSLTQFNLEANFSIRGLGNSEREFEDKRFDAKPNYLYLAGELKHKQVLPYDFHLNGRLSGQVAESPLISNEQFSAGGWQTVRGYHETEVLGDDGVNASLELYGPDLRRLGLEGLDELRFLAFTDAARVWVRSPLRGTPGTYELVSAGAGFRSLLWKHIVAELDWAYPFSATDTVGIGDQRIDFRVAYEF